MAEEIDILKQRVLRTHLDDLTQSGAIAKPPIERGYLDENDEATTLGSEFLTLTEAGLMTDDGQLTDEGKVYATNYRDSLDAPLDIYRKREERGLNQRDKEEQGEGGGFWSMLGDFVTEGVPRMAETAYNTVGAPLYEKAMIVPRTIAEAVTGKEIRLPRTMTVDEKVNRIAENITGGVMATEPLAAGAVYGSKKLAATIQGKTEKAYAAKQEWERHNAEMAELKGAEMMDFLTGSDKWLQSREALVAEKGEQSVKQGEEFDRLVGNFILDPNNVASFGVGKAITSGAAALSRATLNAEKLAMKARVLRAGQVAAQAERATLEAGLAKATDVVENVAERAASFRSVGNEAQALRYEATAARVGERAQGIAAKIDELAANESRLARDLERLGSRPEVAERIVAANARINAARQLPARAVGEVMERVGAGLIKTDAFLAEAAERTGLRGVYQSLHSLPGRVTAFAAAPLTGPIPAAVSQALASGPLIQSLGNFSKILGRELIAERGSVPFWRRVANNSTISKTQRFLAHRMDEATLGGMVTNVTSPAMKAAAVSYPMNLAFDIIQDPQSDLGESAIRAIGPSLVFGGGSAGAGAIFKGSKARLKEIRIADEINFTRNLDERNQSGFSTMNRGGRRAISTYAAAFPNLNWDFSHTGASHYDPVTNTAVINPATNNPLRALVGHEVLHYVTIRNQMQPVVHSMLLGDNITPGIVRDTTPPGILRAVDGTLDPDFQRFKDAYESRMDAAGLQRPSLEKVAEEYFNEVTVDHLMEMVESGELSRMAGRTQAGRHLRAFIDATIPRVPILKDLFFRSGGAMEAGGRYVMGNGLLADGLRELPEARAMMRKLIRSSAGESVAVTANKTAASKEGAGAALTVEKGDPIIDSFHAILETDAAGNPIKDRDGNHIALSKAKDEARSSAGLVLTEAQIKRVNNGYMPAQGELAAMDGGKWFGEYVDKPLIDELSRRGILNTKQIAILRNISTATKTGQGHRFVMVNHPATIKGRGGKVRYATLGATLRETVPLGIGITKDGNILIHLMNVDQLNRNITNRAGSKRGKALYDGNTEAIKQDIDAMMELHKSNTKTDKYYQDKYGPRWEEYQRFINTVFGLMTNEQKSINPMFDADNVTIKDGVYRTYRLDRISKATKMDGTPLPLGYTHVKANFLPDGMPDPAASN